MKPVEIFYSPHADDEALGMAGAILEAVAKGAHVVLVLVTDSKASPRGVDLFTDRLRCHWHGRAKHALAHIDLAQARMLEFVASATALGAHEVAALGIPEQLGKDDPPRFEQAIAQAIRRYALTYPDAVHHVCAGVSDYTMETGRGNLSHLALAIAAQGVLGVGPQLRFHRVYVYSLPPVQRLAPTVRHLSPEIMAAKRTALEGYKHFAPEEGRVAYGYHSVPELFDGAMSDAREFEEVCA